MDLCLIGNNYLYELEKLCRIFVPYEKINSIFTISTEPFRVVAEMEEIPNGKKLTGELYFFEKHAKYSENLAESLCTDEECERMLAELVYKCFLELTNYKPEWGILTGVRPAKLYSRFVQQYGKDAAEEKFKNGFFVSSEKISLCAETAKGEANIISFSEDNSFSLYVSVPFCPSRCSYCSFVSHSVQTAGKLIPDYVAKLCEEIELTANLSKKANLRLETVYIGGGTPTAVDAVYIDKIMKCIANNFDLSNLREYTVEAGRPDTVTKEKLNTILLNGATRISINPQTFNNDVLNAIGRKHTAEQTIAAFKMARSVGFNNINMDLIAGLPSDTFESFKNSVDTAISLSPENVTVHSLSLKRASTLTKKGELPDVEMGKTASQMVRYARRQLTNAGILPYYMYRQSKTVGNLENVGYAKKGFEGMYNVYIMDETHTILACGASAVTKLRKPGSNYIERIFNFKYPYEYLNRYNEMILRKDRILPFYGTENC